MGKVTVATTHGHEWTAANSGKLRRYIAKKKTSLAAQKMNRTFCEADQQRTSSKPDRHKWWKGTHIVGVVEVQNARALLLDLFVGA